MFMVLTYATLTAPRGCLDHAIVDPALRSIVTLNTHSWTAPVKE
jgi:hypothetical protein